MRRRYRAIENFKAVYVIKSRSFLQEPYRFLRYHHAIVGLIFINAKIRLARDISFDRAVAREGEGRLVSRAKLVSNYKYRYVVEVSRIFRGFRPLFSFYFYYFFFENNALSISTAIVVRTRGCMKGHSFTCMSNIVSVMCIL